MSANFSNFPSKSQDILYKTDFRQCAIVGFKYKQASHGGGSKGGSGGGGKGRGGGGGKGGKGGSGKAAKPDTSKKDPKKPLEDQKDLYHDINIELKGISRDLERVQKVQERLYGK